MTIQVGDVFTWEKTFTEDEILQFAELSGDKGRHHMERDEQGRPVFSGDTITCEVTVTEVEQQEGFKKVALKSVYRNQQGKEVLLGTSHGIIRD
jgi:3-hydroxybutyryl-CoA dehydratase